MTEGKKEDRDFAFKVSDNDSEEEDVSITSAFFENISVDSEVIDKILNETEFINMPSINPFVNVAGEANVVARQELHSIISPSNSLIEIACFVPNNEIPSEVKGCLLAMLGEVTKRVPNTPKKLTRKRIIKPENWVRNKRKKGTSNWTRIY